MLRRGKKEKMTISQVNSRDEKGTWDWYRN
jgi:hypothetical protein